MKKRTYIFVAIAAIVLITGAVGVAVLFMGGSTEQQVEHSTEQPAKLSFPEPELIDIGEKYLHESNYEQAIEQFIKVIEQEPMNLRAYLGGTDAYLHLGKKQNAVDCLKSGIDATGNKNLQLVLAGVEKSEIEGYIVLAEAFKTESWHDKAVELLRRVYDETENEIIGRKLEILEACEIKFRDDYVIQWKDAAFESLIRQYLGKEIGDIHYDDVKLIERIEIYGQLIAKQDEVLLPARREDDFRINDGREGKKDGKIKSLVDLEHFTSLKQLSIEYQESLDISALADTENIDCLKRLTNLSISANNIEDMSVVSKLIALETLSLCYNKIVDISPISMLIELQSIDLAKNEQLSSIEPLRGLRKLKSVAVTDVRGFDLNVLVGMPELRSMNLVNIENIDYNILQKFNLEFLEITCDDDTFQIVKQMETLTFLRLHGNGNFIRIKEGTPAVGLTDISGIEQLSNLTRLELLAPNCHDISPLASLNIVQLELDLPDDCDLTPLTQISSLKKVVVREAGSKSSEEDSLINRIRALLPHVEVTNDWH